MIDLLLFWWIYCWSLAQSCQVQEEFQLYFERSSIKHSLYSSLFIVLSFWAVQHKSWTKSLGNKRIKDQLCANCFTDTISTLVQNCCLICYWSWRKDLIIHFARNDRPLDKSDREYRIAPNVKLFRVRENLKPVIYSQFQLVRWLCPHVRVFMKIPTEQNILNLT